MSGTGNRRLGGTYERELCAWLRLHGWPHAERAGGGHEQRHGDIVGIPGLYVEARNRAQHDLAGWCDSTREAARGATWVVAVRRRNVGDRARDYAVTDLDQFTRLLQEVGYR